MDKTFENEIRVKNNGESGKIIGENLRRNGDGPSKNGENRRRIGGAHRRNGENGFCIGENRREIGDRLRPIGERRPRIGRRRCGDGKNPPQRVGRVESSPVWDKKKLVSRLLTVPVKFILNAHAISPLHVFTHVD